MLNFIIKSSVVADQKLIRIRIWIQPAVSFGSRSQIKSIKVTQKRAQNKIKGGYKGGDLACKDRVRVFGGRKSASGVPQMARPGRERS
jgi:hypothetical protein